MLNLYLTFSKFLTIHDLYVKLRDLHSALRTSPQRFELLENACRACNIKALKPILDCVTRWNSTYDMIRNGIYLKPVHFLIQFNFFCVVNIPHIMVTCTQALNSITSSYYDLHKYAIVHTQWITLEKIGEFLEPFKDLTVKMSSSKNSTVYHIIPLFNIVMDHVEDENCSSNKILLPNITNAVDAAMAKFKKYYSKTNTTTMLCTALDPRRKFNYFTRKEFPDDEIKGTKAL